MDIFNKKLEELKKAQSREEVKHLLGEICSIGEKYGLSEYEVKTHIYMSIYGESQRINNYLQGRQFFKSFILKRKKAIEKDPYFGGLHFEMSLDDGLRLTEWDQNLKKLSWPFETLTISITMIGHLLNDEEKKIKTYEEKLQNFLDTLPKEVYPEGKFFFKVGSVSPKGGINPTGLLGEEVPKTQEMINAKEILEAISTSFRVQQELERCYLLKQNTNLIIRPWRRLERKNEFRVFVFQRKWIGTSQMFTKNSFSYTEEEKEAIISASKELINKINPYLKKDSYVIDMYLEGLLTSPMAKMIELNPFSPTTDPILFKDKIFDCSLKVVEE